MYVHLGDVALVAGALVGGLPESGDLVDRNEGADVVFFLPTHRSSRPLDGDVNSASLEDSPKGGDRRPTTVVDGRAGPVQDDGLEVSTVAATKDELHPAPPPSLDATRFARV